jgi:hypothetical protein
MPRPARTIPEIAEYGGWIPDDAPDIPGRLPYDGGTIPAGIPGSEPPNFNLKHAVIPADVSGEDAGRTVCGHLLQVVVSYIFAATRPRAERAKVTCVDCLARLAS